MELEFIEMSKYVFICIGVLLVVALSVAAIGSLKK